MAKTNNTLHLPVILSQEENNKQVLKAGLQPAYGPHASLDAAKTALEAEFNTISNVPRGYTFCIINSAKKPEEWWFTRKGEWSSIAKKQSGSVDLSDLQFNIDEDNNFYYSVDGGETWSDPMPLGSISAEDFVNLLQSKLKFKVIDSGELQVAYDGENFSTLFKLRVNSNGVLEAAGPNSGYKPISGSKFSDLLDKFLSIKVDESGDVKVSSDEETEWKTVGTVKLRITDGNKIWIATNYTSGGNLNWREVGVISVDGGGEGGGSSSNGRLLSVITPDNVGTIPFKNVHESVAHLWSALPACNLIVYMGVDYKESFCAYMNGKYPSAQPGDYVLIQSSLQNNTEPKANANDYTTTFETPGTRYGTSDIVNRDANTSERGYEDCYYIAFKTHEDTKWGLGYYGKKTTKSLADIEIENTVDSVYGEEGVLKGILLNANTSFTVSEIPDIVSLYLNGNVVSRGDSVPAGLHLFIAKENAEYIAANPETTNVRGYIEFTSNGGLSIRNESTFIEVARLSRQNADAILSMQIYPAEARTIAKIYRENTVLNSPGNTAVTRIATGEVISYRGIAAGYNDVNENYTGRAASSQSVRIDFSEVSQGS